MMFGILKSCIITLEILKSSSDCSLKISIIMRCSNNLFFHPLQRDARKLRGQVDLVASDPYDMEDIVMPLRDYIHDPVTRDIVHNGATFQVLQ